MTDDGRHAPMIPADDPKEPEPARDGRAPDAEGQAADAPRTVAVSPGPAPSPRTDSRPEGPAPAREPAATPAPEDSPAPTTVLPGTGRPARPTGSRPDRGAGEGRSAASRPPSRAAGRSRRARLVLQRLDPWSVFLFSLVASLCLGVALLVAVAALYAALSSLGVLSSLNGILGEVAGTGSPDDVIEPFITSGRVLGATAVLAAVDVVLLTALATLSALLYNLCATLTGGVEVQLGERD